MRALLKKMFLGNRLFVISSVLTVILFGLWSFLCNKEYGLLELSCDGIFYIGLIIALLYVYRIGEINVQKALIGALFMLLINSSIEIFFVDYGNSNWLYAGFDTVILILALVIFCCHLVAQSDHVGVGHSVFVIQCCSVMILVQVCYMVVRGIYRGSFNNLDVTFLLGWVFCYLMLACIETRVNEYKKVRAVSKSAGCWNEETRGKAKGIFRI